MDKKNLRKIFIRKRSGICEKIRKDRKIMENLLNVSEIKNADTVLIYVSYGSEIETRSIISELLKSKRVAVPRCIENKRMEFIYINSLDELKAGAYGILEPTGREKAIIKNAVCIVPALSFSTDGTRLGYGGGYYDKFLAENEIYTIGICYEELISEELPAETHDIKVRAIITEERTVQCSAKG